MAMELTMENFDSEVMNSDLPVLIDFWAPWCGPCKMIAPIIEELSKELDGTVKVCKVNIDDNQQLAVKYNVASIPTLLVFNKGELVNTAVGARGKDAILDMVKNIQ